MQKGPISFRFQMGVLILGTIIISFIILMNVIFDQALFLQGINFVIAMQSTLNYPWLHFIINSFAILCNPRGIAAVLFLYYTLVNRKLMLIVHLSYFLFSVYIIALLKQAFQQPRPLWYDSQIKNWEWFCPVDLGTPSGHSFAVMVVYEPIISDYFGYGKKKWVMFILILIGIMVPLSRMYLGVHSANQILFGLSAGLVLLILFKYVYQKALYQLYWEMLIKNTDKKYIKIAGIAVLNILCVFIPIMFLELNMKNRPMSNKIIDNLNNKCGTKLTGEQVQIHMFNQCSIECLLFGVLYGFVLISDTIGFRKYMLGFWRYQTFFKRILKILIHILSFIPALLFFGIGTYFLKGQIIPVYILYCLAVTLAGFSLTYFTPLLAKKYDIIQVLPDVPKDWKKQNQNDR